MITVGYGSKDFYKLENGSYGVGSFIQKAVPSKYRFYNEKIWYVHKKYIVEVVLYIYMKLGVIDYSFLPQEMQLEINTRKQNIGSLAEIVSPVSPYTVLHLTESAPLYIVDACWKAIVKHEHPDVGGDSTAFVKLKTAYETIKGK